VRRKQEAKTQNVPEILQEAQEGLENAVLYQEVKPTK